MFTVAIKQSALEKLPSEVAEVYKGNKTRKREFENRNEAEKWVDEQKSGIQDGTIYLRKPSSKDRHRLVVDAYLIGRDT